jgi:hypothetical protein
MKRTKRWVILVLIAALGHLSGCSSKNSTDKGQSKVKPASLEQIAGSKFPRVTLTESAAQRLGVRTGEVSEERSARKKDPQKAVPYSALWYDTQGKTWVYTSPRTNVFVRTEVEVDFITGDTVYLTKGPDVGTKIAKVAVAELYGTETKYGD